MTKQNYSFLNLTPHEINVVDENDQPILTIPPSGKVARMLSEEQTAVHCHQFPFNLQDSLKFPVDLVHAQKFTSCELPEIDDSIDAIVVSMPVGQFLATQPPKTYNVVGPDTGPNGAVRKDGRIVGTRRLVLYQERIW